MAKNKAKPLTPAVLHFLLALSTHERHGYGIMKQVRVESEGKVNYGPGTLYDSICRIVEAGLIDKTLAPEMDDGRLALFQFGNLTPKSQLHENKGETKLRWSEDPNRLLTPEDSCHQGA